MALSDYPKETQEQIMALTDEKQRLKQDIDRGYKDTSVSEEQLDFWHDEMRSIGETIKKLLQK